MELYTIFLVLCMATLGSTQTTFNVVNYGAVGDGKTDDSEAFAKAWEAVCKNASGSATLNIPAGKTFLLYPIAFEGPCKSSNVHVQINGNLVATTNFGAYDVFKRQHWIVFSEINGLQVDGNGQIDGKGSSWWAACPTLTANCLRPTALSFFNSNNLKVSGLHTMNSQRNHISIGSVNTAVFSNLHLSTPQKSPNTDGIDIAGSTNVQIQDSFIGTGDDCIAVGTGVSNLNITRVNCGPGHGISVGSLGRKGETAKVEGVFVTNCTLNSTMNGVRIKTVQGGQGYAKNIWFKDITLISSDNPIIIDQYYCPHDSCAAQSTAVCVSDVHYIGVHGTSTRDTAINLSCSKNVGCSNINLSNINITAGENLQGGQKQVVASCINAHGKSNQSIPKVNCLLP